MTVFEVGKTYITRSIGDHDCIYRVTVAARTARTIKTSDGKTLRIKDRAGIETVSPLGSYSMSPVLFADRAL